MSSDLRIVICGGGAIGCAIAYFLATRGARPIVLERNAVGGAASGKSGGFLAYDWCEGSALDQLARRSFDLHAELADALGNPWDHRRLESYGARAAAGRKGARGVAPLSWLSPGVTLTGRLGSTRTTAVVEPHAFTTGLMRAAQAAGAELRMGAVDGLVRRNDGAARGVVLDTGETIDADAVVIALGPWSLLAARWLPLPAVYGFKGHSLIFATGQSTPAEALFLEFREASGEELTPEVFPRADGTWVCAISSAQPVPIDPAAVAPDAGAHERLEAICRAISPVLASAPIAKRQACFRPVTEDGLPLIGVVPEVDGAYVATGHSVWGMLNSPATGEAMAELILDGRTRHVDLTPFSPARLRPVRISE